MLFTTNTVTACTFLMAGDVPLVAKGGTLFVRTETIHIIRPIGKLLKITGRPTLK